MHDQRPAFGVVLGVEVAWSEPVGVAVRDTKQRTGPVLTFPSTDWRAFLAQL